ncbi:hypothetical protein Q427_14840 [Halomonas sp. BC04]|nr:hypothetical protein Q427_14840 [Halomonas sp. BC04]
MRVVDTRLRLPALVLEEALTATQARGLIAALDRLQAILLTAQQASVKADATPDGWIDLARLEDDQRLLLRHDLQAIRSLVRLAQS